MVAARMHKRVDAALLRGWATARSLARGLPAPVLANGGWRIDTAAPDERCRYIFPEASPQLVALGASIDEPGILLKLCDEAEALRDALPPRWTVEQTGLVMTAGALRGGVLPRGYRLNRQRHAGVLTVEAVEAATGMIVASGYGAAASGVYGYNRIVTARAHRRKGLGRAIMAALASAAPAGATHMLVATPSGRMLYEAIGSRVCAPYSTAAIPQR